MSTSTRVRPRTYEYSMSMSTSTYEYEYELEWVKRNQNAGLLKLSRILCASMQPNEVRARTETCNRFQTSLPKLCTYHTKLGTSSLGSDATTMIPNLLILQI